MSYQRFLIDSDYNSIATQEHMEQLIRDIPERIPQAEQRAEMNMYEYLDQYYEIGKVLAVGKNIRDYNINVTYPGQVWIRYEGEIYKTLTSINGLRRPTGKQYWKKVIDLINPFLIETAKKYSQLRVYSKGEVVRFGTEYWICETPHGYESNEIHIPGAEAWREAEVKPWEPNLEWEVNDVCSFNGQFYQFIGKAEAEPEEEENEGAEGDEEPEENDGETGLEDEPVLTPEEDDCWGLIGEYSDQLEYDYTAELKDYVVADSTVFYPIINPNAEKPENGVNITRDDPRNSNVVAHMCRIALYYLHQIISPTNISETRRWAYEDSMMWLYNASKFKINPQLPRKHEHDSRDVKVDWALETYRRDYNPSENPWLT